MIKKATFVSVWDDGYEIKSNCMVNTNTNKVFDIEMVCVDEPELDLEVLDMEYIIIDGNKYDVYSRADCVLDELSDYEYWYD